jgi:homoserine kinase
MPVIRVPASTSNLGAGFDCLGVAVDRWLSVATHRAPAGTPAQRIRRMGTLETLDVPAADDLIVAGVAAACRAAGREAPTDLVLDAHSDIPVGRGLGSSAAAIVAGVVAANVLLELGLDDHAIAVLATDLEGHPDNVTPAVYGGAVLALRAASEHLVVAPLEMHESVALVFAVPDFAVETRRARAALPDVVSHDTAVTAAARAAALVRGLATANSALLAAGLNDVLHVPYRRALVPGYDAVTGAAVRAGAFGATLSGSGSTIVAVAARGAEADVERAMTDAWRAAGVAAKAFHSAGLVRGYEVVDSTAAGRSAHRAYNASDPLSFPGS